MFKIELDPDCNEWNVVDSKGEIVAMFGAGPQGRKQAQNCANVYNQQATNRRSKTALVLI